MTAVLSGDARDECGLPGHFRPRLVLEEVRFSPRGAYNSGMNAQPYHETRENVNRGKTLGVFAKRPRAGEVKTRLAAATSPEWAAAFAAACLDDTLRRLGSVEARRFL